MAISGLTQIRNRNTLAVFQQIVQSDGVLRSEIAERTGISLMTVGKIMDILLKRGIVYEREYNTTSAGRKPCQAFLNDRQWWICVFSLTDYIGYHILSLSLKVLYSGHVPVLDDDWDSGMRQAISQVNHYIVDRRLDLAKLVGAGVSAPAPYDAQRDRMACPKRPNLEHIKIGGMLRKNFNTDILIDEDVKLAAIAALNIYSEYAKDNVFYMYAGVGVGGVFLNHGEIYRGSDNYAGDIGQMKLTDGQTVEDLLAWDRMESQLKRYGFDVACQDIASQWEKNEKLRQIVEEYAKNMALAAYNAVCMYSPAAVIIDGKYQPLGKPFYEIFHRYYDQLFEPYEREKPPVRFSFSGMEGSVLGLSEEIRKNWLLNQ